MTPSELRTSDFLNFTADSPLESIVFRKPTPLQEARMQLEEARREKLLNEKNAEYFQAMADMLANRIVRLANAIEEMESAETSN